MTKVRRSMEIRKKGKVTGEIGGESSDSDTGRVFLANGEGAS